MIQGNKTIALALFLITVLYGKAFAQTQEHQRIGVEGKTIAEISPGLNLSLQPDSTFGDEALFLEARASVELLLWKRLSLALGMPFDLRLATALEAQPRMALAPGDLSVDLGGNLRLGDGRLDLGLCYRQPFGVANTWEGYEKRIFTSDGYRSIGLSASYMQFMDPVALGLKLQATTTLPKLERAGESWKPLSLALAFYGTEALNDTLALSASVVNSLSLPRTLNGIVDSSGLSYGLSLNAGFLVSLGDTSVRLTIGKSLSEPSSPASFELSFNYRFRIKEKAQ